MRILSIFILNSISKKVSAAALPLVFSLLFTGCLFLSSCLFSPGKEKRGHNVKAIVAGVYHSYLLTRDGGLFAWGNNGEGQLAGDSSVQERLRPARVEGAPIFDTIASGFFHMVGRTAEGKVYTWGRNSAGSLGDTTPGPKFSPYLVPNLPPVKKALGGFYFTLTLENDSTLWAFGDNEDGQLGDGTGMASALPVKVLGLKNVVDFVSGGYHSLALLEDGTVWAWGWNGSGQIGDGTHETRLQPVQVPGLGGVQTVACGENHSLALLEDGSVWTWGVNVLPPETPDEFPLNSDVPVRVEGLPPVVEITANHFHNMALTKEGDLWMWGNNDDGRLGDGTTEHRYTPFHLEALQEVDIIAAGGYHSFALQNDGTLWAWGDNVHGQLGDGTKEDRWAPVRIAVEGL